MSVAQQTPNRIASSPRRAGLIAGIALLLMAVLAAFGNFGALEPLITPGDAAKTAKDIIDSELLFRLGVGSMILVVALDIIVAVALLAVFEPVNRTVAMAAAWLRVAYAAVFLVAVGELVSVPALLGEPDRALHATEAFTTIWQTSLILFAVHLLLIGYLAYRSGFMPKIFGILLVIAGLGYLADGFGTVMVAGYSPTIGTFTFAGEVALIFWLLIKGRRLPTG